MRQFVPEQGVSSCSLFTQVPVAGEALDLAERLRFIKPQVSSEHWLRRLSEWLSGIGSEVLDGRGSIAMMAADADFRNAWTDANEAGSRGTRFVAKRIAKRASGSGRSCWPRSSTARSGGEEGPATRSSRPAGRFVTGAYDRGRKQADSALVAHVGATLADLPESGIVI